MRQKILRILRAPLTAAAAAYLLTVALMFVPTFPLGALFFDEIMPSYLFGLGMRRVLMAALVCALFCGMLRRMFPRRGQWRTLVWALPALIVAVNNFPLVALASGTAEVIAPAQTVALFVFSNLGVALFEESVFRGVIFPCLLARTGAGKGGRLVAVLVSAALFSLLHLLNLVAGAAWDATLLQLGYTFLLGAMFAILIERGAGMAACVLAHALFNCGGDLVGYVGAGAFADIWCPAELVLTAVVGVAALALFVAALVCTRPRRDALSPGVGFRFAPLRFADTPDGRSGAGEQECPPADGCPPADSTR